MEFEEERRKVTAFAAGSLSRTCLRLDIGSLTSVAAEVPEMPAVRRKRAVLDLDAGCPVDASVSLEQQVWYHGSITRSDAEKLLYSAPEGSYLVRNCDTTPSRHGPCYSIGIKSGRGFMHLKVVRDPTAGSYVLSLLNKSFSSIPEMVHHYSVNKLPIRGAEHMSLRHPVIYQLL